jgi:hypothetical protein
MRTQQFGCTGASGAVGMEDVLMPIGVPGSAQVMWKPVWIAEYVRSVLSRVGTFLSTVVPSPSVAWVFLPQQ